MSSAAALDPSACGCAANLAGGFGCPSFYSPASGAQNGGRGCQCLQRHSHAERTGREPVPTNSRWQAGETAAFGAGSRPSPDRKRRDVTRRDADQSLTAGRDRHHHSPASGQSAPGGSRLRLRADLQPQTTAAPLSCANSTSGAAA